MQDPNTPDPGGQAGGSPPQTATDGASQPVPGSPAIVEHEAPSASGDAVAVTVEVPQAKEQAAETAAIMEPASEEVPTARPPVDVAVVPNDVLSATREPEAQDAPAQEATTGEPPAEQGAVTPSESAADEKLSVGTDVDEAVGTAEGPAVTTVDGATDEVAEVSDRPAAQTAPDAATQPAEFVGDAIPPTEIEEATGTADESEVAPVSDESVSDSAEAEATEEAPSTEDVAGAAQDTEDPPPVGSTVALGPPAAPHAPPTRGVWTPEQVEAFRTRLSEATAKVIDKAAGAVIETVNTVAAAIRSRTSSERRGDDRSG